ncbi:protein ALP1-like [Punica granatum]|uniref:Protein ALP1-like n=1 Tax=Punica granatum TaxID=22663 RepID=A0A6P8CW15_PUNGR|nr:protein ALP1-like [Punica granatum]
MAAGGGGRAADSAKAIMPRPATSSKPKGKKRRAKKSSMHLTPELVSLISAATSAAHSFLLHHDLQLLPAQTLTLESQLHSLSALLSSLQASASSPKIAPLSSPPALLPPPPQLHNCWFHRFLSTATDYDPRWGSFFRMSKPSFSLLLNLLYPALQSIAPSIHPLYALGAALYRLAHAVPYQAVARQFGFHSSADACRSFFAVLKALNDKLGNLLELYSDMDGVIVGFTRASLPNCCGVLGFGKFLVDGDALGRNGSLLVQALVDSEGRFLDLSAGWPGTLKPSSILRKTRLFSAIEESRELLNGPSFELSDGQSIPQYLLGDACYPLLPWLVTPYSNQLNKEESSSSREREFNSVHSRAMGSLRLAFSRLRAKWQLLSRPWKEECIEFFPFAIFAGCLLHNFLIKCGESFSDENPGSSLMELPVYEGEESENGKMIRDALAGHLARVSLRR